MSSFLKDTTLPIPKLLTAYLALEWNLTEGWREERGRRAEDAFPHTLWESLRWVGCPVPCLPPSLSLRPWYPSASSLAHPDPQLNSTAHVPNTPHHLAPAAAAAAAAAVPAATPLAAPLCRAVPCRPICQLILM